MCVLNLLSAEWVLGNEAKQIHLPALKHRSFFFSFFFFFKRHCSQVHQIPFGLNRRGKKKGNFDDPTWGSVFRLHSNWSSHNSLSANSACERPSFRHQSGRLVRRKKNQPSKSSTLYIYIKHHYCWMLSLLLQKSRPSWCPVGSATMGFLIHRSNSKCVQGCHWWLFFYLNCHNHWMIL